MAKDWVNYTDDDYLKDVALVKMYGVDPSDINGLSNINHYNVEVEEAFCRQFWHSRHEMFDEHGKHIKPPKEKKEMNLIKTIIICFFIIAFFIAIIKEHFFDDANTNSYNDDEEVTEEIDVNDPYALLFDEIDIEQLSEDYYHKKKGPYNTTIFEERILYTTSPSKKYIFMLAFITIPGESDTVYRDIRKSILDVDIVKLEELGNYDGPYTFETIYHEEYPDFNQAIHKGENEKNIPGKEKFKQIIYEKYPSIELENDVYKYSLYGGIKIYNEYDE